jgi:uncharacterized protein (TIGR03083 family)
MPIDPAAAYAGARQSVVELVTSASPEQRETTVPACPLWTVTDVVRHLTGVAAALVDGTLPDDFNPIESWQSEDGARKGDQFTDRHVSSRRHQSLDETVAEWQQVTDRMLPILCGEQRAPQPFPFIELVPVNDIAAHLHDIRGALNLPGDRETPLVSLAFASYFAAFAMRCNARGLPPVRVRYGDRERATGEGEPVATWTGERFELFRALAGRRSSAQITAMQWEGNPTAYVPLVSMYGVRADALVE